MRSIIPGHEHCENYRDPVPPTHEIALDPTGERKQTWGWHLFPDFNAITKADFSHQKRGSVRIEYWDVWEMGATRPDAHVAWTGSFFDCLHVSKGLRLGVTMEGNDVSPAYFLVVSHEHSSAPCSHVVPYYS